MSFGVSLKRERELRGISLAEISKATKISVRLLDAIEKDRFEVLPEGVFRKSFIKSYAKYLGMNEEQILHEYDLEVKPSPPQPPPEKVTVSFKDSPAGSKRSVLLTSGILLVLIAVGGGFWFFNRTGQNGESAAPATQITPTPPPPSGQPQGEATPPASSIPAPVEAQTTNAPPKSETLPAQSSSGASAIQTAPAATTTATVQPAGPISDPSALKVLGELAKKPDPAPPAGSESGGPLELTIEADSPSWVSVSVGERFLFAGIIRPAETKKFSLNAPLKVNVGNAGGVRLHVSGQVFSSLGKLGERRTLEVSAANYQQYLAPKAP